MAKSRTADVRPAAEPLKVRTTLSAWDVGGLLAALALFSWMALSAAAHKSLTFDEPPHIASGAAVWLQGDYRLNPESGVLVERWLGLPDLLWKPQISAFAGRDWQRSDVWKVSGSFLYDTGNDLAALMRRSRVMATTLAAALGAFVFFWSRRINGPIGGWISLLLFIFCPTMLAHGTIAAADLPVALFFTLGTWAVWRLVHRVSIPNLIWATGAVSALVLSKFSGLVIVVIAAGLVAVRLVGQAPLPVALTSPLRTIAGRGRVALTLLGAAAVVTLLVGALIWAAYGFRDRAFSPETASAEDAFLAPWSDVLDTSTLAGGTLQWAREHSVLPETFIYGLAHTLKFSQERPAFLNGTFTSTGNLAFFPYAFLVKTPIPFLILALGGLVTAVRFRRRASSELIPLGVLFGVYALFTLSSHLNIGHRYLLPLYPPLFILAGGLGRWLQDDTDAPASEPVRRSPRAVQPAPSALAMPQGWRTRVLIGVAVCLLWQAEESLRARPDYLAYVNDLAGGPDRGYQHLVDSSIDWGQDLPGLATWLDAHRDTSGQVYFSYFGSARPTAYRISARMLASLLDQGTPPTPIPLTGGTYCVSATMLQSVYLGAPGPWTDAYEAQYQRLLHDVRLYQGTAPNTPERAAMEAARPPAAWAQMFFVYEQFRAGRLFAYLRRREPDANVGHSILIYRLTDEDANRVQF